MACILITEPVHPEAIAMLTCAGHRLQYGPDMSASARTAALDTAEIVLVRTMPLQLPGARLRLVAKHGVGVDNIDIEAMTRAGVAVMNTPGANSGAVAEQVILLILAIARDLDGQRAAASAASAIHAVTPPAGVESRTLLVVGYGASGRRVAAIASALGMNVAVCSPSLKETQRPEGYRVFPNLRSGLGEADVISLHCPLNDATRAMIGAAELALLPDGAIVINCARGGLIDERALADALLSGRLGGAGLDVTELEPLPLSHPLRHAPRLILTPHAAAMSKGAFRAMGIGAARNILDFLAGVPRSECIVVPPSQRAVTNGEPS